MKHVINTDAISDALAFAEKEERRRILTAFRKARTRTLMLFGKESAARLSRDFALPASALRNSRVFAMKNKRRPHVWIGGDALNFARYPRKTQTSAGVKIAKLGVIPGAFVISSGARDLVFIRSGKPLPAWAVPSPKSAPWYPRARGNARTSAPVLKLSAAAPEDFSARYSPAGAEAFFRAAFEKALND